jgi:Fe2+ transport system protein FeoA
VITAIAADDPALGARFAARGLVPGVALGMLRTGDPLLIGVDNERWAINQHEAACIEVDLLEQPRRTLMSLLRRA